MQIRSLNILKKFQIRPQAAIFLLLTFCCVIFFLLNSLSSGEDSANASGGIVELIKIIFFPGLDAQGNLILTTVVRKLAHFTEFGVFMGLFNCFMLAQTGYKNKAYLFFTLFIALLCPMIDESIQYLSPGRTPALTDVWIDFGGEISGIIVSTFCYAIVHNKLIIKKRKNERECIKGK